MTNKETSRVHYCQHRVINSKCDICNGTTNPTLTYDELINRITTKKTSNSSITDKAKSLALKAFIAEVTGYMSLSDDTLFNINAFQVGISPSELREVIDEFNKRLLANQGLSSVESATTHESSKQVPDDIQHTNIEKPTTLKYAKTLTPEIHERILTHLANGYTNTAIATLIQREFHTNTTESNIRNYIVKLSKSGLLPRRGKRRSLT